MVARQTAPGRHKFRVMIVPTRFSVVALMVALAVGVSACGGNAAAHHSSSTKLELLTPGALTVSIEPYLPYIGERNGQLTGLDGDIINQIAADLHLKVKIVQSDFPGQLGAVQAHRVDVAVGSIGWTKQRAEVGLFTDPTYYAPVVLMERKGANYTNLAQLSGKSLGTITGYAFIPAIQAVPGAQLHVYPQAANMYSDISQGRTVAGFADSLINIGVAKNHPQLGLTTSVLAPITPQQLAQHPAYQTFQTSELAFYLPKQDPNLTNALSIKIRDFYKDGFEAKLLKKWGADPKVWQTAPSYVSKVRIGVDRPKGWTPPSLTPPAG